MQIRATVFSTALAALLLTGCATDATEPVDPSPAPSATPLFSSEADALAAAEEAYAAYLAVSDAILMDGGQDPDRIDAVSSGEALAGTKSSATTFRTNELHQVGETRFWNTRVQQFKESTSASSDVVVIYACLDVSGVDVIDSAGKSVVNEGRPPTQEFEIHFDRSQITEEGIVVAKTVARSGDELCAE